MHAMNVLAERFVPRDISPRHVWLRTEHQLIRANGAISVCLIGIQHCCYIAFFSNARCVLTRSPSA